MVMHKAPSSECPLCANSEPDLFRIYYDGPLKLYRCQKCGFVAQYTGPGSINTLMDYTDAYDDSFAKSEEQFEYPWRSRGFLDIASRIGAYSQPGAKLLDVGCGDGHFLSVCQQRHAFSCSGVEPSKTMALHASRNVSVDIVRAEYSKDLFPSNSFDVVTLIRVIEHLQEPVSVLNAAWHHLRPNGLLIIEAPSIHSPHFLLYRLTGCRRFVAPPLA